MSKRKSPLTRRAFLKTTSASPAREFDVLVGAPEGVTSVGPDSPYYAGTIAFFGNMSHVHSTMSDASFAVPLPRKPQAFRSLTAETTNSPVSIRIVPSHGRGQRAPALKSATIRSL
jgi:tyrosinase